MFLINLGRKNPLHITASFGLTELDLDSNPDHCIERADKAMYKAKKKGRNCTHIWTE